MFGLYVAEVRLVAAREHAASRDSFFFDGRLLLFECDFQRSSSTRPNSRPFARQAQVGIVLA